jgi:hypothetical protein
MKSKINTFDIAYLAGYLDGDGCFYIGKEKCKRRLNQKSITSIVITSVNKSTLDTFKKMHGGSIHCCSPSRGNQKSLYQFVTKKRDSIDLVHKILPYLVEKVDEAKLFLQFANSTDVIEQKGYISQMKRLKDVANLVSKHHKEEFEPFKNTVKPTFNDFAYLAGFIDAECCLSIGKYKPRNKQPNHTYKILLQCNNTKAPVFKWLLERFGGGITFINRVNNLKGRKNQFKWYISQRVLSKILPNIHPFLRHKKPVCEELIKFYNTTLTNGGARHTEDFRTHYESVLKVREEIVSKVHKLNLKGVKHTGG